MWRVYLLLITGSSIIALGVYALIRAINEIKLEKLAKMKRKEVGSLNSVILTHISGLPVPRGVRCDVHLCDDRFLFLYGDTSYALSFDKLADVCQCKEAMLRTAYAALLLKCLPDDYPADSARDYFAFIYDKDGTDDMILLLDERPSATREILTGFNRVRNITKSVNL